MSFDVINYQLLIEDLLYSVAAGFFVGFINQVIGIFLYGGKARLFIKDLIMFFVFSIVIFSFVISFANYPIIRYYHILCGGIGFLIFSPKFSQPLNFLCTLAAKLAKKQLKGGIKFINSTYCNISKKYNEKKGEKEKNVKQKHLQKDDEVVYNL